MNHFQPFPFSSIHVNVACRNTEVKEQQLHDEFPLTVSSFESFFLLKGGSLKLDTLAIYINKRAYAKYGNISNPKGITVNIMHRHTSSIKQDTKETTSTHQNLSRNF